MGKSKIIDENKAVFLANCCLQAYKLYDTGKLNVPLGYQLIDTFKAAAEGFLEWFGYIIKSSDNLIIVFRGTQTGLEWIENIDLAQIPYPFGAHAGKTHKGFTSIYSSCREQIINILNRFQSSSLNLYVTGHSLGGALAVLCALDLAENTSFKHPVMYSFGSPRIGNPLFTISYNKRIKESFRIVNNYDPIPHLPPSIPISCRNKILYYKHVKNKYPVALNTNNLIRNHELTTYINSIVQPATNKKT